ncbi:hypothetical protein BpHYR1_008788 [Brachionus plicatilis]|uniref:Uncharacterized protein n=1 Tax=Brachionus plicatilis TaxID=10195 RepID=A0A3M7SBX5_BRAPC|nr:hypothetical protein BpHYR1_008788 [Brachionus plicatilis]
MLPRDQMRRVLMIVKTFGLTEFLNLCTDFYFLIFRGNNYIFIPSNRKINTNYFQNFHINSINLEIQRQMTTNLLM